jgi:hypothetical protein
LKWRDEVELSKLQREGAVIILRNALRKGDETE